MKRKIFRIEILDTKGRHVGWKLVDATSITSIRKGSKSRYLGREKYIGKILKTRLKGTMKQRIKLPRSKRFGRKYR